MTLVLQTMGLEHQSHLHSERTQRGCVILRDEGVAECATTISGFGDAVVSPRNARERCAFASGAFHALGIDGAGPRSSRRMTGIPPTRAITQTETACADSILRPGHRSERSRLHAQTRRAG